MRYSTLADVLVESTVDEEALRCSLRRNPYGALAVGVFEDRIVALTADGESVAFEAEYSECLAAEGVWRSVVGALHTWRVARLDLAMLRRHGLLLWCARHRAELSPCGRLTPAQPR
ncbi:hypothetical protein ACQPZF_06755 [Actinosynnema sp. CS-041913]|uniref:hypothetical protein n=1 Tax=Actinosynnema sp. CS-041913 TaxID=3239917 RepID=UPI003D92CA5E